MLIERRQVYSGRIVTLLVDTLQVDGRTIVREVVRHPGGVLVLAELDDGRIPFVRQLRYPMQEQLLELPAGKLDPGEHPETTAARELEEETGFRPRRLHHVTSFYVSPGYCDELLHLYYTREVESTAIRPDLEEEIQLEFYTLDEAMSMALKGEILDGKTLVALFWLHRERSQGIP